MRAEGESTGRARRPWAAQRQRRCAAMGLRRMPGGLVLSEATGRPEPHPPLREVAEREYRSGIALVAAVRHVSRERAFKAVADALGVRPVQLRVWLRSGTVGGKAADFFCEAVEAARSGREDGMVRPIRELNDVAHHVGGMRRQIKQHKVSPGLVARRTALPRRRVRQILGYKGPPVNEPERRRLREGVLNAIIRKQRDSGRLI